MSENVKTLLKGVGVDFVSRTPVNKKIVSETRQVPPKKLSNKELFEKELKEISKKAKMFRILEEAEKKSEEERKYNEKISSIQNKIEKPFSLGREIDTTSMRKAAVDNILPKALIPKTTSYPEPFEEEPALNRELSEFKKKINEHLHKIGIAGSGGGGAGIVGDLDDVNITGRTHKSILMYNDVTSKYEVADPDLDAGISNEDDSGDEIILNATTSGGADESSSIQQENNTRMATSSNTTVSTMTFSTPTITLTDSASATVTVDISSMGFSAMENLTVSRALVSDGSGDVSVSNVTSSEVNMLDGGTSATGTTLAGTDRVITNDAGTMVQVALSDFDTYFGSSLSFPALTSANTFSATQSGSITALSDGANISVNLALNNHFSVTLAGNRTLDNPSNIVAGTSGSFFLTQDGTGSRTLSYGSYYDFAAGAAPTLTTTAAAVDRIDYIARTTTSLHCVFSGNLS